MVGSVAAVDLGATSGRVMYARVGPHTLNLNQVIRFDNVPLVSVKDGREELRWNISALCESVCVGLDTIARADPKLASIGVDSWAVDYGLLHAGDLSEQPHHYRENRTEAAIAWVHARVSAEELYRRNGLQFLPFNTLYQLVADRQAGTLSQVDTMLLIPDLFGRWLSGEMVSEITNASTTGLLTENGTWNTSLVEQLSLPPTLFQRLVAPGEQLGPLLPAHARGFARHVPMVTTVASHDTASAVAAIPLDPTRAAYISCGTWGLVGVEVEHRILTEASRTSRFTNERGLDNTNRYLHNVMGLWLLSESLRTWERDGTPSCPLDDLLTRSAALPQPPALFDVDDPRFIEPGDMPQRINAWFLEHELPGPRSPSETVRVIVESLAETFAVTAHRAGELAGIHLERIHIVGGGALNTLLCQATADRAGLPVLAGPVEATALGNALVQGRAHRFVRGDLGSLRALVHEHFPPTTYYPRTAIMGS